MDVTDAVSALVPSQQPAGLHTITAQCSGAPLTSSDGSGSPANAYGGQTAFVSRERSEFTLFCSEFHGMYIQKICHLAAWPSAQYIPLPTHCLVHRWHICSPRHKPEATVKLPKKGDSQCWIKQTPSQEKCSTNT